MTQKVSDQEQAIRCAFDAGRMQEAATIAIRAYGEEIFSFICSRLQPFVDADEAFAIFAEDLWNGFAAFQWRSSARTWAYTLARNAVVRHASSSGRRAARNLPLSYPGALAELVEEVRCTTQGYRQTEVKDRFRALREQLAVEDQTLLILRIDRDMSWRDLALTLSGSVELDEAAISRESARLRKAFERVKQQLKTLAEQEGLLKAERD